jgi:hypothetical protein
MYNYTFLYELFPLNRPGEMVTGVAKAYGNDNEMGYNFSSW